MIGINTSGVNGIRFAGASTGASGGSRFRKWYDFRTYVCLLAGWQPEGQGFKSPILHFVTPPARFEDHLKSGFSLRFRLKWEDFGILTTWSGQVAGRVSVRLPFPSVL
jgi:hypothetical protein